MMKSTSRHRDPFEANPPEAHSWGWHQDGYRQNSDPETFGGELPRPLGRSNLTA
jgi:hypothetical protein